MGQSLLNNYCLTVKSCCFCISLKSGTIIIALNGFVLSVTLTAMYFYGQTILEKFGVGQWAAVIIVHYFAVIGIVLCALHVVLLSAALTYNEELILLYLWFAIIYIFLDSLAVTFVSISAILKGMVVSGIILFLCFILYWLFLYFYVFPVINGYRKNIHTIVIVLA